MAARKIVMKSSKKQKAISGQCDIVQYIRRLPKGNSQENIITGDVLW